MPEQTQLPPDIVARILLGEAAGEGPEGMAFVRDVFVNRARAQKKTLEQVATAPYQFSAYDRPDLEQFVAKQPLMLRNLANELVAEALRPEFQPKYDASHYVTSDFYENRGTLKPSHWVNQMEPAYRVGRHQALKPRPRR